MTLNIIGAWAFPSSSGSTTYETRQTRGCKHTRQVAPYTESVLLGKLTVQEVAERLGIAGNTPAVSATSPLSAQKTKPVASSSSKTEKKGRLIDFEE
ncbi:MAG: hypothetical protein NT023_07140 [Armatimonadetes bacterium]|nr:hypothetical protein [Armatimonadota bacterium]